MDLVRRKPDGGRTDPVRRRVGPVRRKLVVVPPEVVTERTGTPRAIPGVLWLITVRFLLVAITQSFLLVYRRGSWDPNSTLGVVGGYNIPAGGGGGGSGRVATGTNGGAETPPPDTDGCHMFKCANWST